MQQMDNARLEQWWATGDTPVHTDSRLAYLVDGRVAMLTMCRHFLRARHYIYVGDWGLTAEMAMVRGIDQRVGPDGSPEQETLMNELRALGLDELTNAEGGEFASVATTLDATKRQTRV